MLIVFLLRTFFRFHRPPLCPFFSFLFHIGNIFILLLHTFPLLSICMFLLITLQKVVRASSFPLGSLVMLTKANLSLLMDKCTPWGLADPRHQKIRKKYFRIWFRGILKKSLQRSINLDLGQLRFQTAWISLHS